MVSKATATRLSTCQPPRMPQRTDRTAVLVACATSQSSQTSATCQQLCWQTTAQFGPVIECRCFGCPFHGCRAALAQWPLTTIRARLVSDHCRWTIACRMLHATFNSTARWYCLDAYNTHCASLVLSRCIQYSLRFLRALQGTPQAFPDLCECAAHGLQAGVVWLHSTAPLTLKPLALTRCKGCHRGTVCVLLAVMRHCGTNAVLTVGGSVRHALAQSFLYDCVKALPRRCSECTCGLSH